MGRVTSLFCLAFPARNQFQGLWDARIYALPVGNPFARRHNFYRKVATIRRQSGNEKGGARSRSPDAAQRAALAERCAAEPGPRFARDGLQPGSRFCEAALREVLRAALRPGHAETKGARE